MNVEATIIIPKFIYELYSSVGTHLGNYTPEQAMASALIAYMDHIVQEMRANGELTDDEEPVS